MVFPGFEYYINIQAFASEGPHRCPNLTSFAKGSVKTIGKGARVKVDDTHLALLQLLFATSLISLASSPEPSTTGSLYALAGEYFFLSRVLQDVFWYHRRERLLEILL